MRLLVLVQLLSSRFTAAQDVNARQGAGHFITEGGHFQRSAESEEIFTRDVHETPSSLQCASHWFVYWLTASNSRPGSAHICDLLTPRL